LATPQIWKGYAIGGTYVHGQKIIISKKSKTMKMQIFDLKKMQVSPLSDTEIKLYEGGKFSGGGGSSGGAGSSGSWGGNRNTSSNQSKCTNGNSASSGCGYSGGGRGGGGGRGW
jgi:hypothetical protein